MALCSSTLRFAAAVLACLFLNARLSAATAPAAERASTLVTQAQQARLAGDADRHAALLAQALKSDPDSRQAHWENGEVMFEGQWHPLAKVEKLVAADTRWEQYRELREQSADTAADHLALAQWCLRNGLEAEERYHWKKVLQADPANRQARDRLGLVEFRGQLYPRDQVAELKGRARKSKEAYDKYRPGFLVLCRQVAGKDPVVRQAALDKLRAVSDVAAIEALEDAVKMEAKGEDGTRELYLAVVAALSNMREHEATLRLLDYAVYAGLPEVRAAAIEGLKPRQKTDYVPLLMAALTAPIEAEIGVQVSPDGTVSVSENLRQAGAEADRASVASQDFVVEGLENKRGESFSTRPFVNQNYHRALRVAQTRQQRVNLANAEIAARNQAIEYALAGATGLSLPEDLEGKSRPEAWWQAWFDYNELYSDGHPVYETEYYDTQYAYLPAPYIPPPRPKFKPGTRGPYSCFIAGTPVWTQAGPVPIERLAVGDMVLSKDPVTGELGYKAVLETTLRPPSKTMNLKVGDETITATPGHRFWIEGRGWEMVKFLAADTPLHTLDGAATIASADARPEQEAYNLVVDEFHTYFVGKSRLLVHDNQCPRPVLGPIPGMKAPASSDSLTEAARPANETGKLSQLK